mmetsp:Transcript_76161/g.218215  ORF Transcript_76161/g.218215 Transcript_76161/m.218215 type:complete len:686 (-) Transcript_76161:208-2265(-)
MQYTSRPGLDGLATIRRCPQQSHMACSSSASAAPRSCGERPVMLTFVECGPGPLGQRPRPISQLGILGHEPGSAPASLAQQQRALLPDSAAAVLLGCASLCSALVCARLCRPSRGAAGFRGRGARRSRLRREAARKARSQAGGTVVKTDDLEPGADEERFSAAYRRACSSRHFVAGSWSDFDFEEMKSDGLKEGVFQFEVTLLIDGGDFQIVRDSDWAQVFHPPRSYVVSDLYNEALGPDADVHGLNWVIKGVAGEIFRIELRLSPSAVSSRNGATRAATASCSWKRVGVLSEAALNSRLRERGWSQPTADVFASIPMSTNPWQHGLQQLLDFGRYGGRVEDSSFTAVLKSCARSGAWEAALKLLTDMWQREKQGREPSSWDYRFVAQACKNAGERATAAALLKELREWRQRSPSNRHVRFHMTPRAYWNRSVKRMGCSVSNTLDWHSGEQPVPRAPESPCWMLPASDWLALEIASRQEELRAAGWKLLTSSYDTVVRLENKGLFEKYAVELGLQEHLPKHYTSAESAAYPCILKPPTGEFGKNMSIVRSPADVRIILGDKPPGDTLLLQELVPGRYEYSTSMLVLEGRILDLVCIRYEYDAEEYVWPKVKEVGKRMDSVSLDHTSIMSCFLAGYSGFCNFNYKIAPDGGLRIFEVNTRVGADFACDVPREKARSMMERLASLAP